MKINIVYWSGTGNTEAMAQAVAKGASGAGADVSLLTAGEADGSVIDCDVILFGCPAMGAEVLEESEFEPFFSSVESELNGKKVGLFGSYGWGDGEWMRSWQDRVTADGALLIGEGVMVNESPDDSGIAECEALGKSATEA